MIYGYLRVSTDDQDSNNQKLGVRRKAQSLGLSVDDWIVDDGISGTKEPEKRLLGKLMKKLQKGDVIITSELSRLTEVQISCRDALEVIKQRDTPETFFYLDPPYPGCTQGHYRGYTHKELFQLLTVLQGIKGKFILSNFWCQTLRHFVAVNKWHVKEIDMPLKVANLTKAKRKTEILISNYEIAPTLFS